MQPNASLIGSNLPGTRLYTFVWTMHDVLSAIDASPKSTSITKIVVLDRPNPLGGLVVEGPLLNMSCCVSRLVTSQLCAPQTFFFADMVGTH